MQNKRTLINSRYLERIIYQIVCNKKVTRINVPLCTIKNKQRYKVNSTNATALLTVEIIGPQ